MEKQYEYPPDKRLKKSAEMNNSVYVHLWVSTIFGKDIWLQTDYYTVIDDIVYRIDRNSKLDPSGDTLFTVENDCVKIGVYEENKYFSTTKEVTAKQAIKRFK